MIDHSRPVAICSVALLAFCTGCGGDGFKEIRGTVTYDGKPVKTGTIMLLPPDGRGPTAAAIITDGDYSTKVALGPKQVKIEGFEVKGTRHYPGSMMTCEDREQILPERYNTKTEVSCDVTPGVRTYDFTLKK
jgi:hypothetical protein